jgi:thiol-disulfide isomerase/thioredoxin
MLNKLKEYDFYRRIPKDLTETTTHGSVLSLMAIVFMATLFFAELTSYLSIDYTSNVVVDPNMDNLLRINFNITLLDVPCEFAMIDVIDVLGTREDNVTKNVNKWQVDSTGLRRDFHGRNRDQIDIHHEDHHDLAQLHANGVHAIQLDEADFDSFLSGNEYTFVNFYAPWCVWCQRLEPVWEAFAEAALQENIPVSVVRVDCVKNAELCKAQKIRAFPLLRFFKRNEMMAPDYASDRSVGGFLEFSKKKMSWSDQLKAMPAHQKQAHLDAQREEAGHPGCMMAGFLLVNR